MATAPPCPVRVDAEGFLEPDGVRGRRWADAVYDWTCEACPHADMELVGVRVSNWGGYRLFQQALGSVGRHRLPALLRTLPNANGGITSAEDAGHCLAELDVFDAEYEGEQTVLVDVRAQVELQEYIEGYEGLFVLSGSTGLYLGFGPRGFYVLQGEDRREVFRAMHVRQTRLNSGDGSAERFEYLDLDTGTRFVASLGIPGLSRQIGDEWVSDFPAEVCVESRTRTAEHFAPIIEALRTVYRASVETSNPVQWC